MSDFEHWSLVWAAISAVSTTLAFVVVAVAALFTLAQVREATKARQLESALAILSHTNSPEFREVRRVIYTKGGELAKFVSSNPTWPELDKFLRESSDGSIDARTFHSYMASLENISILVLHDLAPDELINHYLAPRVVNQWQHLSHFVKYMRVLYSSADYLQHFEMLVSLIKNDGLNPNIEDSPSLFPLSRSQIMKKSLLAKRLIERVGK